MLKYLKPNTVSKDINYESLIPQSTTNNIYPNKIIQKETDSSNYGHTNLIYYDKSTELPHNNYGGGAINSKFRKLYEQVGGSISKYQIIKKRYDDGAIQPVKNQHDFFTLHRYNLTNVGENMPAPTSSDEPILSMSLFTDMRKLLVDDYEHFTEKYFSNQIRLILAFKYAFPNGKVRIYFDKYLIDDLEKKDGLDNRFMLSKLFSYDYDVHYNLYIRRMYDQYLEIVKKWDNIKFKSTLHRFLSCYDLACRSYDMNGQLTFNPNNSSDFFVYELKGPFIEYYKQEADGSFVATDNTSSPYKGHKTNGYIGQHIRYISLAQKPYKYNNIIIKRPKHLIWRDGHACTIGKYDAEWIQELNGVCKTHKKELFMIFNSVFYRPPWHDKLICNNKEGNMGTGAGIVQFCNYTDSNYFIPDDILVSSINLPFIIYDQSKLLLYDMRSNDSDVKGYNYGIDEYILTSLFTIKYYRDRSIYFVAYWLDAVLLNDLGDQKSPINIAFSYLLYYLNHIKQVDLESGARFIDIIKQIEKLRYKNDLLQDHQFIKYANELGISTTELVEKFRLLLNIMPSKYHYVNTVFNNDGNEITYNKILDDTIYKQHISEEIYKNDIQISNYTYTSPYATNLQTIYDACDNLTSSQRGGNSPNYGSNMYDACDMFIKNGYTPSQIVDTQIKIKSVPEGDVRKFYDDMILNLDEDNIKCGATVLTSVREWCINQYIYSPPDEPCNPNIYCTGFYDEEIPLDKDCLNKPTDLRKLVDDPTFSHSKYQVTNPPLPQSNVDEQHINYGKYSLA